MMTRNPNSLFAKLILSLATALSACASPATNTPASTTTTPAPTTAIPAPAGNRYAKLNKELAFALLAETQFTRTDIAREYETVGNRLGGNLSGAARERLSAQHNQLKNDLATADKLI